MKTVPAAGCIDTSKSSPVVCNGIVQDVSGISTVEDLFTHLRSERSVKMYDFNGRSLKLTSNVDSEAVPVLCKPAKQKASQSLTVKWMLGRRYVELRLRRGGGIISNVTLELGGDECIHLRGSSWVELRNVIIRGECT